jgi:hypothetical protein
VLGDITGPSSWAACLRHPSHSHSVDTSLPPPLVLTLGHDTMSPSPLLQLAMCVRACVSACTCDFSLQVWVRCGNGCRNPLCPPVPPFASPQPVSRPLRPSPHHPLHLHIPPLCIFVFHLPASPCPAPLPPRITPCILGYDTSVPFVPTQTHCHLVMWVCVRVCRCVRGSLFSLFFINPF